MQQPIQQLLLPRFLLPVRPAGCLLEHHAVLVEDGLIRALLPREEALIAWPDAEHIALDSHVLLPGLINMHTHSPMSLLRGFADDMRLDAWLKDHIWPAEKQFVSPEFVADGTRLAMAEMLRGGTSCFNEMYFFPDVIAECAITAGMRAVIGAPVIELETAWASDAQSCLAKARQLAADFTGTPGLSFSLAPHAPYTVDDESLAAVSQTSHDLDLPVYMHVLETEWEKHHSMQTYGRRVLDRLDSHGLLGSRFLPVHMAHLDDEDIEQLVSSSTPVIHCPESNLKLASGICRVNDLVKAGINVSIGTDGAASNNNLDILGEARTASLLAKGQSMDACAVDAATTLDMLTINAARALGQEAFIGSIEEGKMADMCAIDLDHPETQPLHNVTSQIVYAASNSQFTDVWVAGKRLLHDGELTTIDLAQVMDSARGWQQKIRISAI